jgi:hypothetical protein
MDIVKHEEVDSDLTIFHLTDEVGRVWQTVGTDEKDAAQNWAEGEDVSTFIIKDIKPEKVTLDYLIKSLNIKRSAIIVIQLMNEVLNSDSLREEFYTMTLGYNAAGKIGCKMICRVLFQMKKTV